MDTDKRKALEAAGWKFGDAADFLLMTDEERQLLDTRVAMALAIPKLVNVPGKKRATQKIARPTL